MHENPFSIIEIRLNRLEFLLLDIQKIYCKAPSSKSLQLEEPIKMQEVCRLLQISSTTARAWMTKGTLPFHRKGNRVFFFKSEVLKSLEQPISGRKGDKRCHA